jgi:pimeloyl-ACP methyl ester carboxylesterase
VTARSADGIEIDYDVRGSGRPAIVFVHGWSCDRTYWRRQVDHFAGRHRVVAVDLAGHGRSGDGRTAYTMADFGADVVAVLDREDVDAAVLVGHSMGGDVVVEAARQRPGRVAGLVWVDTYRSLPDGPADPAAVARFMAPFRADFAPATRAFVHDRLFAGDPAGGLAEWVATDMASAPPEVALDAMWHSFTNGASVVAALRELRRPVVALNPEYEPSDVAGLVRHGVTVVGLPGLRHFPMLEDPAAFNAALERVLAAGESRAT